MLTRTEPTGLAYGMARPGVFKDRSMEFGFLIGMLLLLAYAIASMNPWLTVPIVVVLSAWLGEVMKRNEQ